MDYSDIQAKLEKFLNDNGFALVNLEMSVDRDYFEMRSVGNIEHYDPIITKDNLRLNIEALQCADLPREPEEVKPRGNILDDITTPL